MICCWQATLATATQKETTGQIRKDTNEAVEQLHVGKFILSDHEITLI